MSLNQIIDNGSDNAPGYLDIKIDDVNIYGQLKLKKDEGMDGAVIVKQNGTPTWVDPPTPSHGGGDNTYLYHNNGTVSWSPLNTQICSYWPYGKVTGGEDDPDPQNIGSDATEPVFVLFQGVLQENPDIIDRFSDFSGFTCKKQGMFKITLCATVWSNDNSIGFGLCINGIQDYQYGYCATSPIASTIFPASPGFRRGAGQAVCLIRYIYLSVGYTVQVLANKQYQTSLLGEPNYFVGQKSSSFSFEFLGENYGSI